MAKKRAKNSKAALERAERRQQTMLTRGNFLRSQGNRVVPIELPMIGLTALMKRVDLLSLVRSGSWPEPISARVADMLRDGPYDKGEKREVVTVNQAGEVVSTKKVEDHGLFEADELPRTMEASIAIAKACIVVPPKEFQDGRVDVEQLQPRDCKPFFADEDPDEGPGRAAGLALGGRGRGGR